MHIETISVLEWYQSVGLVETTPEEQPKVQKIAEKELQEDESLNVFLDAWNQLDAADGMVSIFSY